MGDALSERIWVGRLATDGDTLVFDASWQPAMPAKVRLYSVERGEWRLFLAERVRRNLQKVREAPVVRSAVDAYEKFEAAERAREAAESSARSAERERAKHESEAWYAAEAERRRERTLALSRAHLAGIGRLDPQYRERAGYLAARLTHCWACKQPLDSRQDLEHIDCGWLVCSCGACGCGRDAK